MSLEDIGLSLVPRVSSMGLRLPFLSIQQAPVTPQHLVPHHCDKSISPISSPSIPASHILNHGPSTRRHSLSSLRCAAYRGYADILVGILLLISLCGTVTWTSPTFLLCEVMVLGHKARNSGVLQRSVPSFAKLASSQEFLAQLIVPFFKGVIGTDESSLWT